MRRQLLTGLLMTVAMMVLVGLAYPLAVTGVAQTAFRDRANGSLVKRGGTVVGSSLIGQSFTDKHGNPDPRYFQPRPSAAGTGYDAMSSSASNLGPSNDKLIAKCLSVTNRDGSKVCDPNTVPQRAKAYRKLNGLSSRAKVPVDAVTASGSGLDPDISVANAQLQASRVAKRHGVSLQRVHALIRAHTNGRQWGFLGEKTVNVLDLNLALDK